MDRQQQLEFLAANKWRLRIWDYAEKLGYGSWTAFPWLKHVAWEVQKHIMAGKARLLINAPPQHGKSELLSHWVPTWYLDIYPHKRVLFTSYGDDFARDWGRKVKLEFKHNVNTLTEISKTKQRSNDWATTAGGGMRSVGVGGQITGRGGDLILVDDPHKDWQEAQSPTYRKRVIDWFKGTLYTRKSENASFIIIQTRWHEDDLTGYLESAYPDMWTKISIPAIAETEDTLGRSEGDVLCPELHPLHDIEESKRILGSYRFAGLYQQRPAPLEGNLVKRAWFRRFDKAKWDEVVEQAPVLAQSWDLTFGDTGNSFVVGQLWARIGADFYLIDQRREKLDFPAQIRAIKAFTSKWPTATTKYVENKANGAAAISTLNGEIPGLVKYNPTGSKAVRLAAVSGLIEAGNVYIPDETVCDWGDGVIDEVVTLPNGSNDDQVDALTMALSKMNADIPMTDFKLPQSGTKRNEWRDIHVTAA